MFKLAYKDVFDTYILHLGSKSPKHTPCSQLPAHSRIGISCCTVDLYLSSKTNILALFYIHLQTYPTCDPLLNMTCLLNYLNLSSGTEILLEYSAGKKKICPWCLIAISKTEKDSKKEGKSDIMRGLCLFSDRVYAL